MQNVFSETLVAHPLRLTLFWNGDKLKRIMLRWHDAPYEPGEQLPGSGLCGSEHFQEIQDALQRYVAAQRVTWPELQFDSEGMSEFSAHVLATLRKEVSWGQTISYGELASLCGKPGAARSIGRAMAFNPWPLIVPCHRVIGAKGDLTGFSGSGLDMKEYLLKTEGSLS